MYQMYSMSCETHGRVFVPKQNTLFLLEMDESSPREMIATTITAANHFDSIFNLNVGATTVCDSIHSPCVVLLCSMLIVECARAIVINISNRKSSKFH